ncbi:MAG: hypothetical protein RJA36_3277 [Pseudomonadota bacterium]|jgi:CRISPR-associated endonuclease Csn1
MGYRLALDLGSTSLGWAMIRLDANGNPCAVIKADVRIFGDGRNPKDGSSLAVTRREARAMRRRRDRLLRRKARMIRWLVEHGFFAAEPEQRKALEKLDPYHLRAEGLDRPLQPGEFARALFHLNQRRGFKSNRKTDKKENDSGALKQAIRQLRHSLLEENSRTVGEWLHRRHSQGQGVRARYRERKVLRDDGKAREQLALNYVRQHGQIKRADVMELCRQGDNQTKALLSRLKGDGRLIQHGTRRGSYYTIGPDAL